MRRNLFLSTLFSVYSCLIFGQAVNLTDDAGLKHGKWVVKYPSSQQTKWEGEFDHGQPKGLFINYLPYGRIESKITYSGDTTCVTRFFQNKAKLAEGCYVNKEKVGLWKFYSAQGFLLSTDSFANNMRNGESRVYNDKGSIIEISNYVNDTLQGPYLRYYKNGALKEKKEYVDGYIEGRELTFYPNSDTLSDCFYQNGLRVGWYSEYLPGSRIKVKYKYLNGRGDSTIYVNGKFSNVYDSGNLKEEFEYKDGQLHGWHVVYRDKVEEKVTTEYDNLMQVNKRVLKKEQPLKHKTRYAYGKVIEPTKYFGLKGAEVTEEQYKRIFND